MPSLQPHPILNHDVGFIFHRPGISHQHLKTSGETSVITIGHLGRQMGRGKRLNVAPCTSPMLAIPSVTLTSPSSPPSTNAASVSITSTIFIITSTTAKRASLPC